MSPDLPAPVTEEIASSLKQLDNGEERSTLSEDILAELSDHLQSAARREQLLDPHATGTAADEPRIWKRVLDRFGDPAGVARQLWWDANWGKLMSQRITIGLLVALSLLCCGLGVVAWQSLALSREAMQQAEAQHVEMMTRLTLMAERATTVQQNFAPAEWNSCQIELRYDKPTGQQVTGAEVTMAGISPNTRSIPQQAITTGQDGLADFGKVLFGEYALLVKLPDGTTSTRKVGVRPGIFTREVIVCPSAATAPVTINIADLPLPPDLAIPDDIKSRVWYQFSLRKQEHASLADLIQTEPDEDAKSRLQQDLGVWQAKFSSHYGVSLLRRPDGTWVQPDFTSNMYAPVPVEDVVDEDLRFVEWENQHDTLMSWNLEGAPTMAAGSPLPIALGDFGQVTVEMYVEVQRKSGGSCLAKVSGGIYQLQQHLPGFPAGMSSFYGQGNSPGISDYFQPALRAFETALQQFRPQSSLLVAAAQEPLVLLTMPETRALLALAAKAKLPAGVSLAQIVVLKSDNAPIGDRMDLVIPERSRPRFRSPAGGSGIPNSDASESTVLPEEVVCRNIPIVARFQSNQERLPLLTLLVGLTRGQAANLTSSSAGSGSFGPTSLLHARPAVPAAEPLPEGTTPPAPAATESPPAPAAGLTPAAEPTVPGDS